MLQTQSKSLVIRLMSCACLGAMPLCGSGCAIAPYDQTTDDSLMGIQKTVDAHIASLESPQQGAAATSQPAFYPGLQNDIHSLVVRTGARSQADPSVQKEAQAIEQLGDEISDLTKLENTNPNAAAYTPAQTLIDSTIKAILTLELQRNK